MCQAEFLVLVIYFLKAHGLGMPHKAILFYNEKITINYYLLSQDEDFQPHSPKPGWAHTH